MLRPRAENDGRIRVFGGGAPITGPIANSNSSAADRVRYAFQRKTQFVTKAGKRSVRILGPPNLEP
jgi:hypothetical protein